MKDLIQEGRNIQQAFKKTMNENVEPEYVKQVQESYYELGIKARKIGKFEFYSHYKMNRKMYELENISDWSANTKSGGFLSVNFTPFENYNGDIKSKFEVRVIFSDENTNREKILKEFSKFNKTVSPSNNPSKDGKMAFDFIKTILMSPEIKQALEM